MIYLHPVVGGRTKFLIILDIIEVDGKEFWLVPAEEVLGKLLGDEDDDADDDENIDDDVDVNVDDDEDPDMDDDEDSGKGEGNGDWAGVVS